MDVQEGYIPIGEHKVWYRVVGSDGVPLLVFHGGPGAPHDYLENLASLAHRRRRVVLYDQLGCGRSDKPDDPSLWRIDRYVDEVGEVARALGLDRYHLLGQSWGGMLAIEYVLTRRPPVASLVLADTGASVPQFEAEARRLRAALPDEVRMALEKHEVADTTEDVEYQEAVMEFLRRHFCLMDPWPEALTRAFYQSNPQVVTTMWGLNRFSATGNLKGWDRRARLSEIRVPTLVLCGRHDDVTPAVGEGLCAAIPNARLVVFEDSAHVPNLEEEERFLQVVGDFLDEAERRLGG